MRLHARLGGHTNHACAKVLEVFLRIPPEPTDSKIRSSLVYLNVREQENQLHAILLVTGIVKSICCSLRVPRDSAFFSREVTCSGINKAKAKQTGDLIWVVCYLSQT